MSTRLNILLISTGEFSGVRPALSAALQRRGCDVTYRHLSLRALGWRAPWHKVRIWLDARRRYGRDAPGLLHRTPVAHDALARASRRLVDQHPDSHVVLLLTANADNYRGPRPPGKQYAIYTDYANLISKRLPDHGFGLKERRVDPAWTECERAALLAQDYVFVMGSHVKPAFQRLYGVESEKVRVVGAGPGLDLDIERDGYSKDYAARHILFVGKDPEKKGLGVLMRAFARVRQVYPDAVLHVVTRQPVQGEGIVSHQSLDGSRLKELFYRVPVFAMPAFKEPLGLVFLEAMWAMSVCIGTNTGAMPELIDDGITGALVEPGDHAALARQLIALFADPERMRRMGQRGYERARSYWHWDQVADRMVRALCADLRFPRAGGAPEPVCRLG